MDSSLDPKALCSIQEYMHGVFTNYKQLIAKTSEVPVSSSSLIFVFNNGRHSPPRPNVFLVNNHVQFKVIADPPNVKLGNGGSTLHVLSILSDLLGEKLDCMKLLIIHSGGYSQRLPSYSVIGKIFSSIPAYDLFIGDDVPQMLDLKLAMYLPFCQILGPGVFVTCADDVETYCLDEVNLNVKELKSADFVALAHPSCVDIGKGHGVYVLDKSQVMVCNGINFICDCLQVLQKPTEHIMRESGAVFSVKGVDGNMVEQIYSDSVFWMSQRMYPKLVHWYKEWNCLGLVELDAYGHILPCLGSYTQLADGSEFTDLRSKIQPILRGSQLKVLVLNYSKFYHLGSMREYLMNLTACQSFISELGIHNSNNVMNFFKLTSGSTELHKPLVINSHFDDSVAVGPTCLAIIEHCHFSIPVTIEDDVIISGCHVRAHPSINLLTECPRIFGHLLYHTSCFKSNGATYYLTVAFDIDSDLKRSVVEPSQLIVYGCSLVRAVELWRHHISDVLPAGTDSRLSLWSLKMFRAAYTPEESFWLTYHDINCINKEVKNVPMQTEMKVSQNLPLFSMADVIINSLL